MRFPCNLCRNIPGARCRGSFFPGETLLPAAAFYNSGLVSVPPLRCIRPKIIARILLPFVNFANLLHFPGFFPILLELWGHTV